MLEKIPVKFLFVEHNEVKGTWFKSELSMRVGWQEISASELLNCNLSLKNNFLGLSNTIFTELPSAGLFLFYFRENRERTVEKTHVSPDDQCWKFLQFWWKLGLERGEKTYSMSLLKDRLKSKRSLASLGLCHQLRWGLGHRLLPYSSGECSSTMLGRGGVYQTCVGNNL